MGSNSEIFPQNDLKSKEKKRKLTQIFDLCAVGAQHLNNALAFICVHLRLFAFSFSVIFLFLMCFLW